MIQKIENQNLSKNLSTKILLVKHKTKREYHFVLLTILGGELCDAIIFARYNDFLREFRTGELYDDGKVIIKSMVSEVVVIDTTKLNL